MEDSQWVKKSELERGSPVVLKTYRDYIDQLDDYRVVDYVAPRKNMKQARGKVSGGDGTVATIRVTTEQLHCDDEPQGSRMKNIDSMFNERWGLRKLPRALYGVNHGLDSAARRRDRRRS